MKRLYATAGAAALTLMLVGCGSNDTTQNAPEETAGNDMNGMMADAGNPFAGAEMQMNDKMMSAVGTDAGDSWAKKMIEHHQGAIDMSRIMLGQNPPADVAKMAQENIDKQQKDIAAIRKLTKNGPANQQSADLYRPAMEQMHQMMMAAKGADASDTFMRKMLEHHKGAVAMSDVALSNGVSGALRQQVQKTRDDNQREASMVEAMLGGQSHHEAMAASGTKSAQEAKAEPTPADKEKTPTAPKTAKPEPAADEHAGHDMNNM